MSNPFEFYNNILGIQARYLWSGRGQHEDSFEFLSYRAIKDRIDNEQIIQIRSNAPGKHLLVKFDSLPHHWRKNIVMAFGEPKNEAHQNLWEKHYQRDEAAYNFFIAYKKPSGEFLEDDKIEQYTINASVLNTLNLIKGMRKEYRKDLGGKVFDIWGTIVKDCNIFRKRVKHTLPEASRPLYNKLIDYNKNGYTSLIHKGYGNKNNQKVDARIEQFLNDMFAGQKDKPTATQIARQYDGFITGYVTVINPTTGEEYNPKEFPKLSESTILNYLAEWRNEISTHTKRSGDRQILMGRFKPYHSLSMPTMANSIISIDDRQPPFHYSGNKRVWFYNGIDLGSSAFTVWVWGQTKEGIIDEFYRQMVRNYTEWGLNLPAEIECEMSLNSRFQDTILRPGTMFQYVHIEANNARGKRIEAYYKEVRYDLEKKREGWLARPKAISESNQPGSWKVELINYESVIEGCLKDIETWNNMPHPKIKNKTRWEVFLETQNPNVKPTNWRAILPYIGYLTKTSCNAGIIKLQSSEFLLGVDNNIALGEQLIELMNKVEGRNLQVYWLDNNHGDVLKAIVFMGDQYICDLVKKPVYQRAKIERTKHDEHAQELMSSYVATITAFQKNRKNMLTDLIIIDNRPITLNNKFKIDMPGHVTQVPVSTDFDDAEILDETEIKSDLIKVENSFKRPLSERY